MAVDRRTHSLGSDASAAPGMYSMGAPRAGPRAACRQRLSDDGNLPFTACSWPDQHDLYAASAAIIIKDRGPTPKIAVPERRFSGQESRPAPESIRPSDRLAYEEPWPVYSGLASDVRSGHPGRLAFLLGSRGLPPGKRSIGRRCRHPRCYRGLRSGRWVDDRRVPRCRAQRLRHPQLPGPRLTFVDTRCPSQSSAGPLTQGFPR